MEVAIYAGDFTVTDAIREHIERKLRLTLTRLRSHIESVSVRLEDINGPKGGLDKCCSIKVFIAHTPTVIIKEVREDMYEAIDTGVHRLAHVVTRKIERIRSRKRKATKVTRTEAFNESKTQAMDEQELLGVSYIG